MKMNLQKFAGKTNVFPVSDNQFKLGASKERAFLSSAIQTKLFTAFAEPFLPVLSV